MSQRISVREARRTISTILASGKAVTVGPHYGSARGFIVGIPAHQEYDQEAKRKALKAAKAAFTAAWIEEAKQ